MSTRWRTSRFNGGPGAGGGVSLDQCFNSVILDCANQDWRLRRTGVRTATIDDGVGGVANISCPGAGSASERFGEGAATTGDSASAFGCSSSAALRGSAFGQTATASGENSTSVGSSSTASMIEDCAFGRLATASGSRSQAIGGGATSSGANAFAGGRQARATATNSVALGPLADCGHADSVCLGSDATSTATNQFVSGSALSPITDVFFGEGVTSVIPGTTTYHGTRTTTSATDVTGGLLVFSAGEGTGSAVGSTIEFRTPTPTGTGTAQQVLATRVFIAEAGVGFGGLTNPGVAATTSGLGVVHLANAAQVPVGALTGGGALFYATGGEMRVVDAAGNDTLLSPHDKETNEWVYRSENGETRRGLEIRMEAFVRAVCDKLGMDFVQDYAI